MWDDNGAFKKLRHLEESKKRALERGGIVGIVIEMS